MALEPGPAAFFNLEQLEMSLEPPLDPGDYTIDLTALDEYTAGLDGDMATAFQATYDLTVETTNLHEDLDIVEAILGGGVLQAISPLDSLIISGLADADQALNDAASWIPQTALTPTGQVIGVDSNGNILRSGS